MTKKEMVEFEALGYAKVPQLPVEAKEGGPVWVKAIACIVTHNMEESYAIVRNNCGGAPAIVKTFSSGGVARIVSVHPYSFLDMSYASGIANVDELRAFVAGAYNITKARVDELDNDQLKKALYNYGILKGYCTSEGVAYPGEEPKKTTKTSKKK